MKWILNQCFKFEIYKETLKDSNKKNGVLTLLKIKGLKNS